jgi:hypothetical protein
VSSRPRRRLSSLKEARNGAIRRLAASAGGLRRGRREQLLDDLEPAGVDHLVHQPPYHRLLPLGRRFGDDHCGREGQIIDGAKRDPPSLTTPGFGPRQEAGPRNCTASVAILDVSCTSMTG